MTRPHSPKGLIMAMSHVTCTHPRTPAGRRACRSGASGVEPVEKAVVRNRRVAEMQAKLEAFGGRDVPRRQRPVEPARIQPRRSGARVTGSFAACVQAALHIPGNGRNLCACGWSG
jgi:hypothetical protein